jgi:hypothetical protein
MGSEDQSQPNVKQAVPFFGVADMQASVRYYPNRPGCDVGVGNGGALSGERASSALEFQALCLTITDP